MLCGAERMDGVARVAMRRREGFPISHRVMTHAIEASPTFMCTICSCVCLRMLSTSNGNGNIVLSSSGGSLLNACGEVYDQRCISSRLLFSLNQTIGAGRHSRTLQATVQYITKSSRIGIELYSTN